MRATWQTSARPGSCRDRAAARRPRRARRTRIADLFDARVTGQHPDQLDHALLARAGDLRVRRRLGDEGEVGERLGDRPGRDDLRPHRGDDDRVVAATPSISCATSSWNCAARRCAPATDRRAARARARAAPRRSRCRSARRRGSRSRRSAARRRLQVAGRGGEERRRGLFLGEGPVATSIIASTSAERLVQAPPVITSMPWAWAIGATSRGRAPSIRRPRRRPARPVAPTTAIRLLVIVLSPWWLVCRLIARAPMG